jgi:MFS family permease
VIYAKETLDAGDAGYGLLLASWGGGMVVGSLAFALLRRASLGILLLTSTAAIGAGYLGMAVAPTLALACVAAAVGGAGNGVQWVSVVSAVQEMTREAMQARVMSVLESSGAVMPAIGYLAGGAIATAFEPRAAFLVAGVGVLAVLAIAAPLLASQWRIRRPLVPFDSVMFAKKSVVDVRSETATDAAQPGADERERIGRRSR